MEVVFIAAAGDVKVEVAILIVIEKSGGGIFVILVDEEIRDGEGGELSRVISIEGARLSAGAAEVVIGVAIAIDVSPGAGGSELGEFVGEERLFGKV
ncbi:MAG: hypothetical protein ACJAXZ_000749, partial [Akkermansiaceae bacterium]